MDGFAVDVDDGVPDGRILGLEVEIDPAEGLLLVVIEERMQMHPLDLPAIAGFSLFTRGFEA